MKLAIPLVAILLAFAWYTVPVNNSVIYKRATKGQTFAGAYDRVWPEAEIFRQPRCKTPGTVWWGGKCYRPERIPK